MTTENTTTSPATNGTAQTPAQSAQAPAAMVKAPPAPPSPPDQGGAIDVFASQANFASAQRMANALASSTMVPQAYQGNIPNVLIAMELASRIGASVFAVMQNIDVIHGRPSWRATFLIATVNACGRFTPLRFRWEGKQGTKEWGCRAVARDKVDGEECIGALITMGLADAENWSTKSGSKWKTMPEQMLMYRAAAFWTRAYAPELALGMQTTDEARDVYGENYEDLPTVMAPGNAKALEQVLLAPPVATVDAGVAEAARTADAHREAEKKTRANEKRAATKAANVDARKEAAATAAVNAGGKVEVERDPLTGEIVPPPKDEGDRGDSPDNW